MSKQKFQIGDEVYVKRGSKNEIGRVGKVTNIRKYGSRLGYIVKYNDNNIFPKSGVFYADMLLFSDMHSLANHLDKGGELPKLSRNELEEMKHLDFKFKKEDFVKLKETFDETESVIGKVIEAKQVKNIRNEIKNSYIIEFLSGEVGGYPEDKLIKYDQFMNTTKVPQNEVRKCKYCGTPFDEIPESKSESGVCEYCEEKQAMISEINIKKSASVDLQEFSNFGQEGDWLEVTEWANKEGIDIIAEYSKQPSKNISLTYDELEAIINIVNKFGTLPPIYTKIEIEK